MTVYKSKSSKEDFSASRPAERLGKLKWWFVVLIVLGVLALIVVWLSRGDKAIEQFQKIGASPLAISVAYAQGTTEETSDGFTPRIIIMAGVFAIIGIVYLAGIFKLFFSRNSEQVDTAADLVKTLTGFFVGAATGFLG